MKLPKAKFSFSTKEILKTFELDIKISSTFQFFYTTEDLPTELLNLPNSPHGPRQYFDSFHSLESSINDLVAEFEVSLVEETKTKVILYAIDTESHRGQKIDFRFIVAQRVEIGRKRGDASVRYFQETKRSGHHIGNDLSELNTHSHFEEDFLEMAWTAEREAWFKSMENSIEKLAQRLTLGFGKAPEILARKIDPGAQFLLPGNTN